MCVETISHYYRTSVKPNSGLSVITLNIKVCGNATLSLTYQLSSLIIKPKIYLLLFPKEPLSCHTYESKPTKAMVLIDVSNDSPGQDSTTTNSKQTMYSIIVVVQRILEIGSTVNVNIHPECYNFSAKLLFFLFLLLIIYF